MHQSLSLSVFGGTLNLDVNAKNVNEPAPLHFTYLHYVSTDADEWVSDLMMTTSHSSFSAALIEYWTLMLANTEGHAPPPESPR